MARLFDAYIAIDWSARSKPSPVEESPDSVWVGEYVANQKPTARYFNTRQKCFVHVRERLIDHVAANRRVFVGFDFPYGYPQGFSTALGLGTGLPPWSLIWNELTHLVSDHDDNSNNRFEVASIMNLACGGAVPGPSWGCPVGRAYPHLFPTSPPFPFLLPNGTTLERLRIVETRLSGVQPTWKLWGNGSVGGQSILGIPVVQCLREDPDLRSVSKVWPFEVGFGGVPIPMDKPFVLHAEIWPGVVKGPLENGLIRDQAQVRAMVNWLRGLDASDTPGALFDAPTILSPEELALCTRQEGWILGVR